MGVFTTRKMGQSNFVIDFVAGGTSGAIAKTCTAPIERVKLIIQTQDANPRIISGEIQRYTGIGNCFTRVAAEQGIGAFWRGNFVNILRYFPTQAFNFAFKDTIKAMFPKYSPKKDFWSFFAVNMASGGLAGAGSLTIVYPLDYARTRLASDVGSGKRAFEGLGDCLKKTAAGPAGVMGLYNGFGVSVVGIIPFRGTYFGVNDTLVGMIPPELAKDHGVKGIAVKFGCAQTAALCAVVASRCSPRSQRPTGCTREPCTASPRSSPTRACLLSSRVPVPTLSVPSVPPSCSSCTVRSGPPCPPSKRPTPRIATALIPSSRAEAVCHSKKLRVVREG